MPKTKKPGTKKGSQKKLMAGVKNDTGGAIKGKVYKAPSKKGARQAH